MSITATEIQNIRFSEARRGYNPDEVDEFLERVAADVDALNRAIIEAAARINDAEERVSAAEERAALRAVSAEPAALPVALDASSPASNISDDVISRAFIAAQISADNLKDEARKEAEKLYREAEAKARDYLSDAHTERSQILAEIDYLREVSERFRTEFLSMVNHYNTDAQKRFADFSMLIPEGSSSDHQSVESMLEANNAAVVSSSASQAVADNRETAQVASETVAVDFTNSLDADDDEVTAIDVAVGYVLDDDLEIEEID